MIVVATEEFMRNLGALLASLVLILVAIAVILWLVLALFRKTAKAADGARRRLTKRKGRRR